MAGLCAAGKCEAVGSCEPEPQLDNSVEKPENQVGNMRNKCQT
jgi:hypothetical protein